MTPFQHRADSAPFDARRRARPPLFLNLELKSHQARHVVCETVAENMDALRTWMEEQRLSAFLPGFIDDLGVECLEDLLLVTVED